MSDYKTALEVLDKAWNGYGEAREIVRQALLIADKLMQEPSDEMIKQAVLAFNFIGDHGYYPEIDGITKNEATE